MSGSPRRGNITYNRTASIFSHGARARHRPGRQAGILKKGFLLSRPPDGGAVELREPSDHVLLGLCPSLLLPSDSAAGVSSRRYVEFIKAIPFIILLMLVAGVLSV